MDIEKYIEVRLVKCRVFLTPAEIHLLLISNPKLFALAVKRGKGILRSRANRNRQAGGKVNK